jgi:hypothetical protein
MKLRDIADIVGMILQEGWEFFSFWEEDGKLFVAGERE